MKKLFTLSFFIGLLSYSFAQPGNREQYNNHNNYNGYNSSKGYQNSDRNDKNDYAYGNHRNNRFGDNRDRDFGGRDDFRANHEEYRGYGRGRRMDYYPYRSDRRRSFFQVIFNTGRRHY